MRRLLYAFGTAALWCTAVSHVCGQSAAFEQHMRQGAAAQRQGNLAEAAAQYEMAARENPRFAPAWMNAGIALYAAHNYTKALEPLRRATELEPRLGPAWFFTGLSYFQMRRFGEAIPALRKAHELLPQDAQAAFFLGQALVELHHLSDGLKALEAALALKPSDMEILYATSQAYLLRAVEVQERMLKTDPKHPRTYQLLGQLYEQQNDLQAAREEYTEMIKANPDASGAHALLAALDYREGKLEDARREYEAEVTLSPWDAQTWARLGHVALELKDLEAAQKSLAKALELDPSLTDAQLDEAAADMDRNRTEEAIALLERVTAKSPDNKQAHFLLAKAWRKMGKTAQSQQETQRFNELARADQEKSQREARLDKALGRASGQDHQ